MESFLQIYKKPLLAAAILHGLLLIALCLNWQLENSPAMLPATTIVQATLVTEKAAPAAKEVPAKPANKPQEAVIKPTATVNKPEPAIKSTPAVKPIKPLTTALPTVKPNAEAMPKPLPPKAPTVAVAKPKLKPKPDGENQQREKELAAQLAQEQEDLRKQKQQQARANQQAAREKQLQEQLAMEENTTASTASIKATPTNSAVNNAEIDKYRAMILAAISQHWIIPPGAGDKSCQFLIHLAPGGVVLDVTLLKSSGDSALDRSARVAVFKASPLPVPADNANFNAFRELNLTVHPKSV